MSAVRDHFVYTAYDCAGRVLYVGCTKDLAGRKKAHRSGSDWFPHAARFHIRGPFDRRTGREIERERLTIERPLYGFHPARRTLVAIYERIGRFESQRLIDMGMNPYECVTPAYAVAKRLTGYSDNRTPIDITDDVLRLAFQREREYTSSFGTRAVA